ncbi:hypothetical protein GobsT_34710 [Gemmata obscuriglobus]|uniref:hypothetical protein n=1 Tax=Gemmata obscuriglobus TaxID=114 RepID=UPI00016C493C
MRFRFLASVALALAASSWGRAAVVVIGNYTDSEITFRLAEPGGKAKPHKLPSNHVVPLFVTGPVDLSYTANGKETKLRLDTYNAYVFLPDEATGFRFEGLELPGDPLERDTRIDPNPVPRDPPVKVPVTLLVDDAEQRTEKVWQAELRKRFDEAAGVLEKGAGVKFVLDGFDTWKSDPDAKDTAELLAGLEKVVQPKGGGLVVGYTSRRIDPMTDPSFGAGRGLSGRHILVREWTPKSDDERTEVLIHFLAKALGGVGSPDPGSALRPQLGDGYALRQGAVLRLDPLNALLLNLWGEERRRAAGVTLETLSPANRARLMRVYQGLLKAAPGDPLVIEYIETLERPRKNEGGVSDRPRPAVDATARAGVARAVIRAVRERARGNTGSDALRGDALTAEYVRVAVEAALRSPGPEVVPGVLLGLGIALDDAGGLLDDALTSDAARGLETDVERKERVTALGNPTLAGRRDLCRRFFLGGAVNALAPERAERVAVGRAVLELHGPANLCLPALAAEFAGGAFAQAAFADADLLHRVAKSFTAADYLPPTAGLRDGLSAAKFEELYGGMSDGRFLTVLADIRARVRELKLDR